MVTHTNWIMLFTGIAHIVIRDIARYFSHTLHTRIYRRAGRSTRNCYQRAIHSFRREDTGNITLITTLPYQHRHEGYANTPRIATLSALVYGTNMYNRHTGITEMAMRQVVTTPMSRHNSTRAGNTLAWMTAGAYHGRITVMHDKAVGCAHERHHTHDMNTAKEGRTASCQEQYATSSNGLLHTHNNTQ